MQYLILDACKVRVIILELHLFKYFLIFAVL